MNTEYFWAKIELLGRRVRYGRCSVVDFLGAQMLRVEVPYPEKRTKPAKPIYSADVLNGMHEAVLSLECKKAGLYPPATVMTREAMIDALLKLNNAEEEEFASVEEYAPGALYARTILTEEQVRKALEPWKPAAPPALTAGNEDPFGGEWEESAGPTSEKKMQAPDANAIHEIGPGDHWSHEYPDVDGDTLLVQSPRTKHETPHIAEIGVIVDKSPTIAIWCPSFAQLKALHNRISDILVDHKFYGGADAAREIVARWIDLNEHSYVAAHIDLEDCPRCKTARLHPQISQDGSAYEADHCTVCGGTWWAAYPVTPKPEMVKPRQIMPKYDAAALAREDADTLRGIHEKEFGVRGDDLHLNIVIKRLATIQAEANAVRDATEEPNRSHH